MSELLQHCIGRQGARVVLVLALAFLFVPYLVDVVYLGDLTPTHFAQELETEDKGCHATFDTVSATNVVERSPVYEVGLFIRAPSNVVTILSNAKIVPLQYLTSATLISRPPPHFAHHS